MVTVVWHGNRKQGGHWVHKNFTCHFGTHLFLITSTYHPSHCHHHSCSDFLHFHPWKPLLILSFCIQKTIHQLVSLVVALQHNFWSRWQEILRSLMSSTYSTCSPIGLHSDLGLTLDFTSTFFEWDYCQTGPSPVLVQSEWTARTRTGLRKIPWTVLGLCSDSTRSPLRLFSDCPKTSYDLFNIIKKWTQPELNPWLNLEIF